MEEDNGEESGWQNDPSSGVAPACVDPANIRCRSVDTSIFRFLCTCRVARQRLRNTGPPFPTRRLSVGSDFPAFQRYYEGPETSGRSSPNTPWVVPGLLPAVSTAFDSRRVLETQPTARDLGKPVTPTPGVSSGRTGRISQLLGRPSAPYAWATDPGRGANVRPLRRRPVVPASSSHEALHEASLSGSTHQASGVAVCASCHRHR